MDRIVEDKPALFTEVFQHLEQIQAQSENQSQSQTQSQSSSEPGTQPQKQTEPSNPIPLDAELLKRASRSLDHRTPQPLLHQLLQTGELILLQSKIQDPQPLTKLLETVIGLIPFDTLRVSISTVKLIDGLNSSTAAIQLLCLTYLAKAADSPSGAGFIACDTPLVQTLVTVWLSSENTELSQRALEAIVSLLMIDSPSVSTAITTSEGVGEAQGQGLFWRRVFLDPEVYELLFKWTSFGGGVGDVSTEKGRKKVTIRQARLWEFIVRIAGLDWGMISTTKLPDVEKRYLRPVDQSLGSINGDRREQPFGGILKYAASEMIDPMDYLMEILRGEFFGKLFLVLVEEKPRGVTEGAFKAIQDVAAGDEDG